MKKIENNVAIKVEHLYNAYNENTESQSVCLCDNNLELEKNKIHYIIGGSGSGKSTLVNHFNGLFRTRYGNVYIENKHKIGNDFFVNHFFMGVVNNSTLPIKLELNGNQYVVAFQYISSKRLIKFLFEAYYKTKVVKINKLKIKKENINFFVVNIDATESKLTVKDHIDFNELVTSKLNNFKKWTFLKNLYLKPKKIKKIKEIKKNVGLVFQFPEYQLFKDTVLNDVMFGPITLGIDKKTANESAIHFLNKLKIGDHLFLNSPFNLSGGQKRRVAIAGILAFDPNILVFDEPTAGLDPVGEEEIMKIILERKHDGKTIVVISHNMDHVLEVADNVIVMNEGEIIQTGSPYEIFNNQELLKLIKIDPPMIIDLINKLSKIDPKFKELNSIKPRNVNQLADAIISINKL